MEEDSVESEPKLHESAQPTFYAVWLSLTLVMQASK
jgi:hypothetical protein